jgi:enoyl-CoA hydratase/carnithine racemase
LVLDKPVIMAVNGDALGAGTELVQAADIRIAVPTARFGLPEVQRGIIPGGGSISRLPRQIPWARAAELLLLGDPVTADQALAWGLLNEVVAADGLLPRSLTLAGRLAANAPLSVQAIKRRMREGSGVPLNEALRDERREVSRIFKTVDASEGPRAFIEKRPPKFVGS